ncbi:MAG: lysine biosynthesis protein LysW [Candidatus Wukongarchaeota archaeon]|nr:lysine biosynthesis protein LysW [Candidatus Wukongarchaeota archaeon]MDO8127932.1 lysine biosynthesis protein LysW [Candidatus Wukongarchaeota archaeon]
MVEIARTGECPECGALIGLKDPLIREITTCEECGVTLEVISIEPLLFEIAELEGEDWGE